MQIIWQLEKYFYKTYAGFTNRKQAFSVVQELFKDTA